MPAPVSGAQAFLQECWQMLSPEDDLMQLQQQQPEILKDLDKTTTKHSFLQIAQESTCSYNH